MVRSGSTPGGFIHDNEVARRRIQKRVQNHPSGRFGTTPDESRPSNFLRSEGIRDGPRPLDLNRTQEVVSSILISSTNFFNHLASRVREAFFLGVQNVSFFGRFSVENRAENNAPWSRKLTSNSQKSSFQGIVLFVSRFRMSNDGEGGEKRDFDSDEGVSCWKSRCVGRPFSSAF